MALARSLITELREHGITQLATARRNELLATMARRGTDVRVACSLPGRKLQPL